MRILVTGSRTWPDDGTVEAALEQAVADYATRHKDAFIRYGYTVVTGACPSGADRYADRWAHANLHPPETYPANWRKHGKRAGLLRNERMVELGADVCLAFLAPCEQLTCTRARPHPTHGAEHCSDYAETHGIRVVRHHLVDDSPQGE